MDQVMISDLHRHVGETVTIRGWLHGRRSSGKIQFIQVRDGSGIVQGVLMKKTVDEALFKRCDALPQESSLSVKGTVRAEARAPGGHELSLTEIEIHQEADRDYPIAPKEHSIGFLMEHRHLWLRSRKPHATLRIRATIVKAVRDFFDSHGFLLIDAPIFTPAACEGTTTLFEVQYFDEKAYLTQSGQLYMEAAAMAHGRVYCFGPAFRAEKSKTRRHLTEFWMVEPEMAYGELEDVMQLAEGLLTFIVERVLESRREDLKVLERDLSKLEAVRPPFPRISYSDAVERIKVRRAELLRSPDEEQRKLAEGCLTEWGGDFGAPDETLLSGQYDRPVLVHRYPAAVKAFYMKRDPADERLALCVDVLAPEGYGEIIGGGQRADSLEFLESRIAEHGLPREAFQWYLDLRKYGSVPHSGFGLGIERTVAWICGAEHLRECIPFPRMLYKIYP
ncbi:MAG: asparagine--tRNA ligase [Planctomycetes bacterium]|nr:asparagine--tRNA ligase [Planctomycetota bacterium]MBI3847486.1 asparagine--tRNA ligase [Planctomycetota bacterium]